VLTDQIRAGHLSDVKTLEEWKQKVIERDKGECVNCTNVGKVTACFIIPPEVGGKLRTQNGVTVCRDCRIAAEGARVLPTRIDNKTPINFLISAKLHKVVMDYASNGSNYGSVSSVVRGMMNSFIASPELFEDMALWQDIGSDVKVNGWVDGNQYELFKNMCNDRGISYTDALKSLLLMAVDGYTKDN
jgi:hypothetical protein